MLIRIMDVSKVITILIVKLIGLNEKNKIFLPESEALYFHVRVGQLLLGVSHIHAQI